MRYRLRTLLIALAVAPPVIGYWVSTSIYRGHDSQLRFDWPDPILPIAVIGWIVVWFCFARRSVPPT